MTNAQRLASSVNTGQVIFWGPRATEAGRGFLSAGLNAGYPRVYAPNPVQRGSSISHFDTVLTPNELMEPAITPPPGPYAYLTSGLLEDIGWKLLSNGVFDLRRLLAPGPGTPRMDGSNPQPRIPRTSSPGTAISWASTQRDVAVERDDRKLDPVDRRYSEPAEGLWQQPAVGERRLWHLAMEHFHGMGSADDRES